MLTNVEISGSALMSCAPEHIPDVFEGSPLVAALLLRADGGELIVRGELARDRWEQRIRVPARREGVLQNFTRARKLLAECLEKRGVNVDAVLGA